MISVGLQNIGFIAEGINNWQEATAILSGVESYTKAEIPILKPSMLKPNERRRTTKTIKIALQAAEEALRDSANAEGVLSVFSSAEGDLDIIDQICLALSKPDRPVSPTQFHNSVHNAPAGYWSIGSGSHQGSSSLGGLEGSFAAGLMEAAVQCTVERRSVLLVSYDQPPPPLLEPFMSIKAPVAVAMLLIPETSGGLSQLNLKLQADAEESRMIQPELEQLRIAAPAARSLPLLEAISRKTSSKIIMPYLPGMNLQVETSPC